MREDLSDWSEPYYYPPKYQRFLLNFGAKAHRCSVCRVNFVSFFPRERAFEPSWRMKPSAGETGPQGNPVKSEAA